MKLNVAFLLVTATVAPAAAGTRGCGGSLYEVGTTCEKTFNPETFNRENGLKCPSPPGCCIGKVCIRPGGAQERRIGNCLQATFENLMGGRKCGKETLKESGNYCRQRCNKMGPNPGDRCLENCLELKYYENDPAPVDKQAVDPTKDNPIMIINAPYIKAKHPAEDIADANAPAVKVDCHDKNGVITGCWDGNNNNIKNNNNTNNNNKNNNNKNNKNNNNNEVAPWEHSHKMEKMENTEMKEKMEKKDNANVNHPKAMENMEKKDNADAHHSPTMENMEKNERKDNTDAHHSPTMENMEKKEKKEKMEKSDYWRSGGEPWPVPNYEYKATHKAKDEEPQE